MIKVRVRNFQSIVDASIVIEGLTVITGENNAGKSAFFRAIRGAFSNARGHDFVRVGQSHCTVDLVFEDGQTLTWEKGKKVNRYVVNGKVFDKVAHGVPPEARIFGVEPVTVNDTELWPQIASQVTGVVFLLDQPGSVIAEAVADVERVNQLSNALKACESDKRGVKTELKLRAQDAQEFAERRALFVSIEPTLANVQKIETQYTVAERTAKAITNLDRLGTRRKKALEEVQALAGITALEKAIPLESLIRDTRDIGQQIRELRALRERWQLAKQSVVSLSGLERVVQLVPTDERMSYVQKFRQGISVTVGLVTRLEQSQGELNQAMRGYQALSKVTLDDSILLRLEKFTKGLVPARNLRNRLSRAKSDVAALEKELLACEKEEAAVQERVASVLGHFEDCPTCGVHLDSPVV